jgi:RNA polymerase sigma factor (sigma-70 family)
MYFDKSSAELSHEQMEQVRTTFAGLLYKQRYHPQFIAKNLDELLGIAHLEYARYAEKEAIEDPVAWTVHCAYRRLQNFLTRTNYTPREVSSEMVAELVDEDAPTPDQIAEDRDRSRKVRGAVDKLDVEQRQLLALVYFEGRPLAEAARRMGWHESRARRVHEEAARRLKALLGVESIDELAVEVGIATWLSFAGSGAFHLPPGLEAILDKAGNEASNLWARVHDLGRRLHIGGRGDAAGMVASADSGSSVVTCLKAAAICIAGAGVVVHTAGGGDHHIHHADARPIKQRVVQAGTSDQATPSSSSGVAEAPVEPSASEGATGQQSSTSTQDRESPKARASSERRQVREQTSGIARASGESEPVSTAQESSSATASASAVPEATSTPAPSGGSSAESSQATQQFGAFK